MTIEDRVRKALKHAEPRVATGNWWAWIRTDRYGDVKLDIGPLWPNGERETAVVTVTYCETGDEHSQAHTS